MGHEIGSHAAGRCRASLSRRGFLGSLGALILSGAAGTSGVSALAAGEHAKGPAAKAWSLGDFAKNVQAGGPPKDGIPPIDRPKYVGAAEADKLPRPADIVFGLEYGAVVLGASLSAGWPSWPEGAGSTPCPPRSRSRGLDCDHGGCPQLSSYLHARPPGLLKRPVQLAAPRRP